MTIRMLHLQLRTKSIYLVLLALLLVSTLFSPCRGGDDAIRVISGEELAGNVGENDGPIWLSILGEVFDVTKGRTYYEKGSSYDYFAGTDATVSFFSGDFTDEGRTKSLLDLKPTEMESIEQWISFYKDHDEYTFLGLLDGEYYNADGAPTPLLNQVRQIVKDVKIRKSEVKLGKSEL